MHPYLALSLFLTLEFIVAELILDYAAQLDDVLAYVTTLKLEFHRA